MRTDELDAMLEQRTRKTVTCWEWTGSTDRYGYARLKDRTSRQWQSAARIAHELYNGPIPPGLEIDHLCRNRGCVNPAHLEAVTHQTNMSRGAAAQKTACNYGHDWTEPHNLYVRKNGKRYCAECHRQADRTRRRHRQQEA